MYEWKRLALATCHQRQILPVQVQEKSPSLGVVALIVFMLYILNVGDDLRSRNRHPGLK